MTIIHLKPCSQLFFYIVLFLLYSFCSNKQQVKKYLRAYIENHSYLFRDIQIMDICKNNSKL